MCFSKECYFFQCRDSCFVTIVTALRNGRTLLHVMTIYGNFLRNYLRHTVVFHKQPNWPILSSQSPLHEILRRQTEDNYSDWGSSVFPGRLTTVVGFELLIQYQEPESTEKRKNVHCFCPKTRMAKCSTLSFFYTKNTLDLFSFWPNTLICFTK